MAKRKQIVAEAEVALKKKVEAKQEVCNSETEVARLEVRIETLEQRLDRIVAALSKSKSVTGM